MSTMGGRGGANAKITNTKAISSAEVVGTKGQDRRGLVDSYLDELLVLIDDFFARVPDGLKPELRREYWNICRARLEATEG